MLANEPYLLLLSPPPLLLPALEFRISPAGGNSGGSGCLLASLSPKYMKHRPPRPRETVTGRWRGREAHAAAGGHLPGPTARPRLLS